MATTEPLPRPPSPVSQDDGMEAWSNPTEDTGAAEDSPCLALIPEESACEDPEVVTPPPSPVNTSSLEDEVFILPPPCRAPSPPAEGRSSTAGPDVRAPDRGNPQGLDGGGEESWSAGRGGEGVGGGGGEEKGAGPHRGAAEEASPPQDEITPRDPLLPQKQVNASIPARPQPHTGASCLTHTDHAASQAAGPGQQKKPAEPEDDALSEETFPEPPPPAEDYPPEDTGSPTQTHPNMAAVTQTRTVPPCGSSELCECKQTAEETDRETREPEGASGRSGGGGAEECVDRRPLDYSRTKEQWLRGNSDSFSGECVTGPVPAVSRDLQQGGALLLHRLRLVQQRQDEELASEQRVATGTANEDGGRCEVGRAVSGGEEGGEGGEEQDWGQRELHPANEGERASRADVERARRAEEGAGGRREASQTSSSSDPILSSSALPVQTGAAHIAIAVETVATGDDQRDSGVSADCSSRVAASSWPPATAGAGGTPALREQSPGSPQEDQDVVEIPFKPSTLLTGPLQPSGVGPSLGSGWPLSDRNRQREISQDVQRETPLVTLGQIPGKGSARELKERKTLFEAFQQGATEGPTRRRRPPASSSSSSSSSSPSSAGLGGRGHGYPSVLDRMCSLELLSLRSCRPSRTHSLKRQSSREARERQGGSDSNPGVRVRTAGEGAEQRPVTVEGGVTLVASNQDKRQLLCRSLGSLQPEPGQSWVRGRGGGGGGEWNGGSAVLRLGANPFFKLRPALSRGAGVEKDIQEGREREDELRRQRCRLYGPAGGSAGDHHPGSPPTSRQTAHSSGTTVTTADFGQVSKLDLTWPPPPTRSSEESSGQTQGPRPGQAEGQKTALWRRWEEGMVNGQQPREKD